MSGGGARCGEGRGESTWVRLNVRAGAAGVKRGAQVPKYRTQLSRAEARTARRDCEEGARWCGAERASQDEVVAL